MLGNGVLKLAVDLKLSKSDLLVGSVSKVEDATIVLVGITLPHGAGLA